MSTATLMSNVSVFDGMKEDLIEKASVLIEGNKIARVTAEKIEAEGATVIDGVGRTLMPGVIDAHFHTSYSQFSVPEFFRSD